MHKVFRQFLLALAALISLATATSVKAGPAEGQSLQSYLNQANVFRAGMGEDPGIPEGAPMTFPAGVRLAGAIMGALRGPGCGAGADSAFNVQVCVPLCNDNNEAVVVTFPAGLSIISKSASRYQNGLLPREIKVSVAPTRCGDEEGIPLDADPAVLDSQGVPAPTGGFMVRLDLSCLNESMAPSEPDVPYALGPVVSDPAIRELLAMLGNRKLDDDLVEILQTAVYSITEGRGLTPADRSALRGL